MASGPFGLLSAVAVEVRWTVLVVVSASHHRGVELQPAFRELEAQLALNKNSTKCDVDLADATERTLIVVLRPPPPVLQT